MSPSARNMPLAQARTKEPGMCDLGYCRAPKNGRAKYCSPEHGRLAQDRQDYQARALLREDEHLTKIARREAPPIPLNTIFVTVDGVVLDGGTVRDLRDLMRDYRDAMAEFTDTLSTSAPAFAAYKRQFEQRVQQAEQTLLARLDEALPRSTRRPPPDSSPR